ncbi:hypothetical protein COLO4_31696 [Corchorus olitorius]|uniref:Gnk2-homologous domain-containing protein n=1 Tax=Corchorus olitorius TaxID=93759 RepID=A0A1R3H3Q0_9ROSI|nr:hypothetical protein COLO4_31696 [Corchorus olitorius]
MVAVGSSLLPLFLYSLLPLTLALDVFLFENCTQGTNFTASSTYQANLNSIVSQLSSLTEFNNGFYNLSTGTSPDNVNAIALCTADRTRDQCISCVNYTITELRGACPWNKEAIAWSEFCMVKYANRNLFGNLENDPRKCAPSPTFAMNPDQFNAAVSQLMNKLNINATAGDPRKYASGQTKSGFDTVYGSVQCTPDLDDESCGSCLNISTTELLNCCSGKIGCRVLSPNCMLRFESNPFENEAPEPPGPPPTPTHSPTGKGKRNNSNTTRIVIIVIVSVVGSVIVLSICIFSRRRNSLVKARTVDGITGVESLQFNFDAVQNATDNFSESNKLGAGGFGAVYKIQLSE